MLIRAHNPTSPRHPVQPADNGNFDQASETDPPGGWATISQGFAAEGDCTWASDSSYRHPSGRLSLGVAAITTNLGWPAGAITSLRPTTCVAGGHPIRVHWKFFCGRGYVARASAPYAPLGGRIWLGVQSSREREVQTDDSARQGLKRLGRYRFAIGDRRTCDRGVAQRCYLAETSTACRDEDLGIRPFSTVAFAALGERDPAAIGCADGAFSAFTGTRSPIAG